MTFCTWGQLDETQSLTEAMCCEGVRVEVNSGGWKSAQVVAAESNTHITVLQFQDSGLLFKLKLLVEHRFQEGKRCRPLN